jgi:hypothetical protein
VIGQAGSSDTVYAAASFVLPANVDTLFLEGSAIQGTGNSDAVDTLYGNAGIISMLVAGSGTDTLVATGIAGTAMTGGAGADTFAFPNQMGHDVVTNFGLAKDTLQFSATLNNIRKTSLTASNFNFVWTRAALACRPHPLHRRGVGWPKAFAGRGPI